MNLLYMYQMQGWWQNVEGKWYFLQFEWFSLITYVSGEEGHVNKTLKA